MQPRTETPTQSQLITKLNEVDVSNFDLFVQKFAESNGWLKTENKNRVIHPLAVWLFLHENYINNSIKTTIPKAIVSNLHQLKQTWNKTKIDPLLNHYAALSDTLEATTKRQIAFARIMALFVSESLKTNPTVANITTTYNQILKEVGADNLPDSIATDILGSLKERKSVFRSLDDYKKISTGTGKNAIFFVAEQKITSQLGDEERDSDW